MNQSISFKKSVLLLAAGVMALLSIPFIAMQFTAEVVWTTSDFLIASVLLFTTGLIFLVIRDKMNNQRYKIASGLSLFSALLLIWVNLAVGIIGSESNEFNSLFYIVHLLGLIGALLARFQWKGMGITLTVMAAVHIVLAVVAIATGQQHSTASSISEIIGVNMLFAALFGISAFLFFSIKENSDDHQ